MSEPTEPTTDEKKSDRVFFWVAGGSLALAFGVLFAMLESAYQGPAGFAFRIGGGTWAAFALGAAGGLLAWKLVSQAATARATLILLLLVGLATFLYPLRFLQMQSLAEVVPGLAISIVALTCLGLILWRIKCALDRDEARNGIVSAERGMRSAELKKLRGKVNSKQVISDQ